MEMCYENQMSCTMWANFTDSKPVAIGAQPTVHTFKRKLHMKKKPFPTDQAFQSTTDNVTTKVKQMYVN